MTKEPPFFKMTQETYYKHAVVDNMRRDKLRKQDRLGNVRVSDEIWEMVKGCWRDRPHLRLSMKHVLACLDVNVAPIYESHKPPYFTMRAHKNCESGSFS